MELFGAVVRKDADTSTYSLKTTMNASQVTSLWLAWRDVSRRSLLYRDASRMLGAAGTYIT